MRIAEVLCGGDSPTNSCYESKLLELEWIHFVALAETPLAQQRIAHIRNTRKRLLN